MLVLAASGGVGGWLCQVLKAKGAYTIATVGSEEKVQVAKDAGAEVVCVESEGGVVETVKKLTGWEGVAAVFDVSDSSKLLFADLIKNKTYETCARSP